MEVERAITSWNWLSVRIPEGPPIRIGGPSSLFKISISFSISSTCLLDFGFTSSLSLWLLLELGSSTNSVFSGFIWWFDPAWFRVAKGGRLLKIICSGFGIAFVDNEPTTHSVRFIAKSASHRWMWSWITRWLPDGMKNVCCEGYKKRGGEEGKRRKSK